MAEDSKILFFLQLPKDFFNSRRIKKLRRLPDGDSLVLLYLKIQLSTLSSGGMIELSGLEDDPADEIALEISEDPEKVHRVLDFMLEFGLAENAVENKIFLPYVEIMTASHTKDAERMRKARKNKKEREANAERTRDERSANGERTIDEQTFDRIKSIEYRAESIEQKSIEKDVNVPSTSIPTVPESICSLSNDNECGTGIVPRKDVRLVTEAWNALGLTAIKDIKPDTERGRMVKKRILDYGVDEVLNAIRNVGDSPFLMGKTGKFRATFDWVIRPNNFPKVLEGNYSDRPKRTFEKTDIAYRAARKLGRLVSERAGVPEPKEETLQAWAGELADCVAENQTSFDDFADVMAFSQEDPFWRKTVLDAASLRKHYVKLMAEMNDGGRE